MADRQGLRVARAIAAQIAGAEPPPPFDGTGFCPIESAPIDGPSRGHVRHAEPVVRVEGPSADRAGDKRGVRTGRLARWFDG